MPTEAEVDADVAKLEPARFFIRTYNNDGELKGEVPLKKYAPVYVGRALGCQIDLVEPSISRRHCAFQYKDLIVDSLGNTVTGFMIYDLKSSHGTFLNEKRIPSMENIKLKHDDKITMGLSKTVFKFWDSKHNDGESASEKEVERNVVDETLMAQQPSSTSQSEEVRNENENDSWFVKYMKVLDQLTDFAKEYEEQGIQIPDENKRNVLAKKFKVQNTKLIQHVQVTASLLTEVVANDPSDVVPKKKGRNRRTDTSSIDKTLDQPKPKRGRKSRKVIVTEEVVGSPRKTGRGVQKVGQQKLANEVQKQIQASLQQNSNSSQDEEGMQSKLHEVRSTDDLFSANGSQGIDVTVAENNPLSIINGPLLQTLDQESDAQGDANIVDQVSSMNFDKISNSVVANDSMVGKRTIRRPKKWDGEVDYFDEQESKKKVNTPSNLDPNKKRRGRPPKIVNSIEIIENTEKDSCTLDDAVREIISDLYKSAPPVKRKRGRQPNPLKALTRPLEPIEINEPKRRRGRQKKILSDDVPLVEPEPPQSPQSELIAVNNPIPSNINGNGNYRPLTLTLKPRVLVRKIEVVQSSEKSPIEPDS